MQLQLKVHNQYFLPSWCPCGPNISLHLLGGQWMHEQTGLQDWLAEASSRALPCHAKGIETAPFARLRLRVLILDSVSSSPWSSDFLSAMLARKRSVTESHSSGSSKSKKPRQMMQVAARRTTLKITSCFKTSTAAAGERKTGAKEGAKVDRKGGWRRNKLKLINEVR